ncbi:MAG TPA: 30S ribosomal protein S17 [Acidobacteriota bacterium]
MAKSRGNRRALVGTVVRDKMNKSRIVAVERLITHPFYGKIRRQTATFMVHDEENMTRNGDQVRIVESRPLSARKRWVIRTVLRKSPVVDQQEREA